jgi:hypothetical protein
MSPPSSRFLMVIGFHSCVTMESLLISYVGLKNTVFWQVFVAVSMIHFSWDYTKRPLLVGEVN